MSVQGQHTAGRSAEAPTSHGRLSSFSAQAPNADRVSALREVSRAGSAIHSRSWMTATTALLLSVALLLGAAVLFYVSVGRLGASFGWVEHTDEILLQTAAVEQSLADTVGSARGYVLSGDSTLLDANRKRRLDIEANMKSLKRLVAANPAQLRALEALEPLIAERLGQQDRLVGFGPANVAGAAAAMHTPANIRERQETAAAIRTQFSRFRTMERGLLAERARQTGRDTALSIMLAISTGILAIATGAFGILTIQREAAQRRARELQLELMHTQRLGMMGETASMLAHEINQPLTATSMYLSALRRFLEKGQTGLPNEAGDLLQRSTDQIQRASGIVQRLRGFIAKKTAERTAEEPATLVADAVALFGTFDSGTELDTKIEADLPPVMVDRIQLQQVLVNLIRNALEAMKGGARHELRISAEALGAKYVQFSVQDTGSGLPKHVEERLFQPFVSGKEEGLGVGLSICKTIITDHGGRIWAQSIPGDGTAFHFTLPVARRAQAA